MAPPDHTLCRHTRNSVTHSLAFFNLRRRLPSSLTNLGSLDMAHARGPTVLSIHPKYVQSSSDGTHAIVYKISIIIKRSANGAYESGL